MNNNLTIILQGDSGSQTFQGPDLLGFESFVAFKDGEYETGGPGAGPFDAGDRITVTIPEYEYQAACRVTSKTVTRSGPRAEPEYVIRFRSVDAKS